MNCGAVTYMTNPELDELRQSYKAAIDDWVNALRAEEALATADHSMISMERWDKAGFAAEEAQKKAKTARDKYKDALRLINYGI